jgi:NADP-dependent 3-hydroxy acid dehydrogenase YdfG
MSESKKKTALVTGATAGIGEATAFILSKLGYDLIITGRRSERLASLKDKLECQNTRVTTLAFDVRDRKATQEALNTVSSTPIDLLVNNAGLAAGIDPVQAAAYTNWDRMIETNITGLLNVSGEIIPRMVSRKSGHVINIGSIAGKEVYANGSVYCASKHAVDALSRGMRLDLVPHNIKVTNIAPGLVETEFSLVRLDQDADKAKLVYRGMEPLTAQDIADCIEFAVTRPKHVVIGDMLVLPASQGNATIVNRQA